MKVPLIGTAKHRPQCTECSTVPPPTLSDLATHVLERTPEQKIRQAAQSQRRARFAFFSLPKQSRVDHICKCLWGGRSTRNEALGREKNELIESASRNAWKLEIRKKNEILKELLMKAAGEAAKRAAQHDGCCQSAGPDLPEIQISVVALSLAQGSTHLFCVEAFASFQWSIPLL